MKFKTQHLVLSSAVMLSALLYFSGCSWLPFGKKSDMSSSCGCASSNDVLLTINGKTALTAKEYEDQLDMVRKVNPQVEMLLQMMPNAEKDLIFKSLATAKLMKAWADKEGIASSADFKKEQSQLHDAMDMQLYMKHFEKAHPVTISDSDLEKFYDEKKDVIPALTLTPGGVETSFVRFESKAKAESFFEKAKTLKSADAFKKYAEDQKQHAGAAVINDKSPFSDALKSAVLDVKKFPHVQVVKVGDDAYWVVLASGKSEVKYRDFKSPEVQQGLKKMMGDEQKEKQLMQMIEELKKDLNVVENTQYFADKEEKKRAEAQASAGQSADEMTEQESVESEE